MHVHIISIDYVTKRWSIAPFTIDRYIIELILRVKDDTHLMSLKNVPFDWLCQTTMDLSQDWKNFNGTIISAIAASAGSDERVVNLFVKCDLKLIEDACLVDLGYGYAPTKSQIKACKMDGTNVYNKYDSFGYDTMTDALIYLTKYPLFAQKIAESDVIIESLILTLHNRTLLHFRYDLIIYNLLKLNIIQTKKSYLLHDLCETLIMLLEIDRKSTFHNLSTFCITDTLKQLDKYFFDTIIDCLKIIFKLNTLKFNFVHDKNGNTKIPTKFFCCFCKNILTIKNPIKIDGCKHNYCFFCVTTKLKINKNDAKCAIKKCNNKFPVKEKELKINHKLKNEICSSTYKITLNNGDKLNETDYSGTVAECWTFIKHNWDTSYFNNGYRLDHFFQCFCDFMINETTVYSINDLKKLQNHTNAIREKGNQFCRNKEYLKAIECYQNALKICPNVYQKDKVKLYSNMAINYWRIDDYLNAYKCALKGLAFGICHIKLSNILLKCYKVLNITDIGYYH